MYDALVQWFNGDRSIIMLTRNSEWNSLKTQWWYIDTNNKFLELISLVIADWDFSKIG